MNRILQQPQAFLERLVFKTPTAVDLIRPHRAAVEASSRCLPVGILAQGQNMLTPSSASVPEDRRPGSPDICMRCPNA